MNGRRITLMVAISLGCLVAGCSKGVPASPSTLHVIGFDGKSVGIGSGARNFITQFPAPPKAEVRNSGLILHSLGSEHWRWTDKESSAEIAFVDDRIIVADVTLKSASKKDQDELVAALVRANGKPYFQRKKDGMTVWAWKQGPYRLVVGGMEWGGALAIGQVSGTLEDLERIGMPVPKSD